MTNSCVSKYIYSLLLLLFSLLGLCVVCFSWALYSLLGLCLVRFSCYFRVAFLGFSNISMCPHPNVSHPSPFPVHWDSADSPGPHGGGGVGPPGTGATPRGPEDGPRPQGGGCGPQGAGGPPSAPRPCDRARTLFDMSSLGPILR